MPGLPIELYNRCRDTLLKCSEFDSHASLLATFVADELYPFRSGLPDATSKGARVDSCLDFLLSKHLTGGRPVLPLFLATLRDRYQAGDALHNELGALVETVQSALTSLDLPSPVECQSQPALTPSPQTVTWPHFSDLHFHKSRAYDEDIVPRHSISIVQSAIIKGEYSQWDYQVNATAFAELRFSNVASSTAIASCALCL